MSDLHMGHSDSGPEPTIPAPPPFVGDGTTGTQDSAKARVVMIATEHDSRGAQADVTEAWDALMADRARLIDLAEQALDVLERERVATGVDEWDEADPRCLLYCAAWEVLGEDRGYEVVRNA